MGFPKQNKLNLHGTPVDETRSIRRKLPDTRNLYVNTESGATELRRLCAVKACAHRTRSPNVHQDSLRVSGQLIGKEMESQEQETRTALGDSSGNGHDGEIRGATSVSDNEIRRRAPIGLAEFGHHAVDVLTEALKHEKPDVRAEAPTALGMIGKEAKLAVPSLNRLAKEKDQRVVAAADQALARIEGSTLIESLLDLFE